MGQIVRYIFVSSLMLLVFGLMYYPNNDLHVVMCDVGQGDSMLIYRRFSQIIIDGGPNDQISDCLENNIPWFDRNIEIVIMSHPQDDHIFGLTEIFNNYKVGNILTSGFINDIDSYWSLVNELETNETNIVFVKSGDIFRVGDMELNIFWPLRTSMNFEDWKQMNSLDKWNLAISGGDNLALDMKSIDPNVDSIVFRLDYGETSLLSTGDVGFDQEQALLDMGVIKSVDVLKVPHHGSKFSSSEQFLEATRPKWAMISVGKNNRFGHPSSRVLMYLDMVGAEIRRTDENGTIELVSDGKDFWEIR